MAGFQPTRSRVGFFADDTDDIDDWMAQRDAQRAMRGAAEAAGREAWAQGIETGDDIKGSTPDDLIRLGEQELVPRHGGIEQDESPPTRLEPAQPDGPLIQSTPFRHPETVGRSPRPGGARTSTPASKEVADLVRPRFPPSTSGIPPEDVAARRDAYLKGYLAGILPGVGRGAQHAGEGVAGGARLAVRMGNPVDRALGHSALDPLAPMALGIVGTTAEAFQHPSVAWDRAKSFARHAGEAVVPGLAPLPTTASAARQQGRRVGMNDGEIGFNISAIGLGGEAAQGLEASALKRTALDAAGYERRGIPSKIAGYFAEPYKGMGSHWFSRDATWPDFLGGGKLPSWFIESRYNVWKPVGATRGQLAEGHYVNDLRFGGGPLPDARGKGSGWSGKRLGWLKNPPVVAFIERAPAVTKGTLAGGTLAASNAARAGGEQR